MTAPPASPYPPPPSPLPSRAGCEQGRSQKVPIIPHRMGFAAEAIGRPTHSSSSLPSLLPGCDSALETFMSKKKNKKTLFFVCFIVIYVLLRCHTQPLLLLLLLPTVPGSLSRNKAPRRGAGWNPLMFSCGWRRTCQTISVLFCNHHLCSDVTSASEVRPDHLSFLRVEEESRSSPSCKCRYDSIRPERTEED